MKKQFVYSPKSGFRPGLDELISEAGKAASRSPLLSFKFCKEAGKGWRFGPQVAEISMDFGSSFDRSKTLPKGVER